MLRILLLGKFGQLGWELHRSLGPLGDVIALDYPDIDLSQPIQAQQLVREVKPEVIVNASAYTAVDRAESEPLIAHAINAHTPEVLADEAHRGGIALIHYSTDYVFDGIKNSPYVESDTPNPLGIYGQSKLDGERAIQDIGGTYLILRTSWVYSLRRDSFVTKVLQWSRQQPSLKVVADQVGNPTWARMLAEITAQLLAKAGPDWENWLNQRAGLYHLAGSGYTSRLEWCKAILHLDPHRDQQTAHEVLPALTSDFPTPAQRPLFSALNCDRFQVTFGLNLPDWYNSLRLAMD